MEDVGKLNETLEIRFQMKEIKMSIRGYRNYKYFTAWKEKGVAMVAEKMAKGDLSNSLKVKANTSVMDQSASLDDTVIVNPQLMRKAGTD